MCQLGGWGQLLLHWKCLKLLLLQWLGWKGKFLQSELLPRHSLAEPLHLGQLVGALVECGRVGAGVKLGRQLGVLAPLRGDRSV